MSKLLLKEDLLLGGCPLSFEETELPYGVSIQGQKDAKVTCEWRRRGWRFGVGV